MDLPMKLLLLTLLAALAAVGRLDTMVKRREDTAAEHAYGRENGAIIPRHDWHVQLDDPVKLDPNFHPEAVQEIPEKDFADMSDGSVHKALMAGAGIEESVGHVDDVVGDYEVRRLKDTKAGRTRANHWVDRSAENLPAYGWSVRLDQPDDITELYEGDVKRATGNAEDVNKPIVSGQTAEYGEHPYICSLQRLDSDVWYHACGSVIYNENTIMTAAHCVAYVSPSDLRVKCGEYRLKRKDRYEQVRKIQTVRVHPGWTSNGSRGYPNDLAVLQTTSSLTFNSYVNTVTVDDGSTNLAENCVILGWGSIETSGSGVPSKVRDVTIGRMSNAECARRWGSHLVNDGHICFQDHHHYHGACDGDSGGPAVCGDRLVGVTSYGVRGCISTYYPSVYTRLSFFYDWIVANAF